MGLPSIVELWFSYENRWRAKLSSSLSIDRADFPMVFFLKQAGNEPACKEVEIKTDIFQTILKMVGMNIFSKPFCLG